MAFGIFAKGTRLVVAIPIGRGAGVSWATADGLAVVGEGFQVKGHQTVCGNSGRCMTFCRLHLWYCGCSGSLSRPGLGKRVLGECS